MRMEAGFVFLDEALSGVRWDAKYATWDNFTGTPVDGYEVNRIVGSLALANAPATRPKTRDSAGTRLTRLCLPVVQGMSSTPFLMNRAVMVSATIVSTDRGAPRARRLHCHRFSRAGDHSPLGATYRADDAPRIR